MCVALRHKPNRNNYLICEMCHTEFIFKIRANVIAGKYFFFSLKVLCNSTEQINDSIRDNRFTLNRQINYHFPLLSMTY